MNQDVDHCSTSHSVKHKAEASPPAADAAITLRPVQPDDGKAIHALLIGGLQDVLADRQRWLSRWRWRYWDNPYRRARPAGWVLTDQERVVGHLGAVYVPIRVGTERMTGMIGADYVVAEEAIARGNVFAGLLLCKEFFASVGDCLPMATSANEKTGAIFTRFGCQTVGWTKECWRANTSLSQQIRTLRGVHNRVIRGLLSGWRGALLRRPAGRCYQLLGHKPAIPIPPGCKLETTVPQLAWDLGTLSKRVAATDEQACANGWGKESFHEMVWLGIDRSQEYLDWRYNHHPERENIRVLVVRDQDNHPIGAAVIFCEDRGTGRIAYVEEMIVLPDRLDVVQTLFCAALRLAHDHNADYLVTMTGRRAIRDVFWELGFENRARSAPAAVIQKLEPPTGTPTSDTSAHQISEHIELWHGDMF